MTDLAQMKMRMRALLKSARDKHSSFFHCLDEVKAEIESENLDDWLWENLRLTIEVVAELTNILNKADRLRERRATQEALEIKRTRRARAAAARRAEAEQRRAERAREAAECEQRRAERREERAREAATRRTTAAVRLVRERKRRRPQAAKLVPTNPQTRELLERFYAQRRAYDIQLGKILFAIKENVAAKREGKNPETNKYWTWKGWVNAHLDCNRQGGLQIYFGFQGEPRIRGCDPVGSESVMLGETVIWDAPFRIKFIATKYRTTVKAVSDIAAAIADDRLAMDGGRFADRLVEINKIYKLGHQKVLRIWGLLEPCVPVYIDGVGGALRLVN